MKKWFTSVLSALLLVVLSLFGLVGCGTTESTEKTIALNASVKELVVGESFTLTATTNPADAEIVWSSSNEAVVTVENGTVLGVSVGTATVTAKNDTATATCEVTVKAAETQKYNVVFKNGDVEIKSVEVNAGETVSYSGISPSKPSTEQYSYTFSGWALSADGEVVDISTVTVDGDKTFYAVFSQSVRSYNVTWNVDGATESETVAYGATPEYKGTTPTKPTVGNTSYTFKGWATSLSGEALETLPTVVGDVTFYAVFEEVTAQTAFTVTWKNGGDVLETDTEVEYEAIPTYDGATPAKEATAEKEYVFVGWSATDGGSLLETLPEVTADVTYYAVFEEAPRKYTITWMIEGEEYTTQGSYGYAPEYDGTPAKADSEECSYKFDGWALSTDGEKLAELPVVDGEATYYALFVVDVVFELPKFLGGSIQYSANDKEIFLPEGLLAEGVSIETAKIRVEGAEGVTAYENGAWLHEVITLTEEELMGNLVGVRALDMKLSNGDKYSVDMQVYAGIIDEFADFPKFFNNTAEKHTVVEDGVEKEVDAAPDVYGYYIVTKDMGAYTGRGDLRVFEDELALTQTALTDYQKTNGFNGVLDGQGHTLKFKLTSGGLVGLVLGNATIKNLAVIYEDASFISQAEGGGYGVFGYITNGSPEIRNCYIERTNNIASRSSVFGIMARPNAKLILHNTVVNAYRVTNDCTWWSTTTNCISSASTNAYVIHGRANAATQTMAANFTKVYTDAIENGSLDVPLADIEDASGFDDNYWYKENGKLIWNGFERVTISWVKGDETIVDVLTKGDNAVPQELPEDVTSPAETVTNYWTDANGDKVTFGQVYTAAEDATYTLVTIREIRYYTVTWNIDGEETTTEYEYEEIASHEDPVKEENEYYSYAFKGWSLSEDGEIVELGAVTEDVTYYAVFEVTAKVEIVNVAEPILYSTQDQNLFLPEEITFELDETVKISSTDGTVYYENGVWAVNFALTAEQIKANEIGATDVVMKKGDSVYYATVKSYAGVIDELSDFPAFFNNTAVASEYDAATYPAVAPNVYGYYIITKSLGSATDELTMTQTEATDYQKTNGFNGVLDGQGHKLQFKLMSGGLVGMILGNCTIKNLAVVYEDGTYDSTTRKGGYGVFGYLTNGAPVIENCYIERTNNLYHQGSVFGIMSRPNAKLVLKNTVVHGNNTSNASAWYSNMWISANSTNAFIVYARSAATGWANVTGFTEVVTGNTLTSDLSAFDTNYWNTSSGINWKGLADSVFSSYVKVTV